MTTRTIIGSARDLRQAIRYWLEKEPATDWGEFEKGLAALVYDKDPDEPFDPNVVFDTLRPLRSLPVAATAFLPGDVPEHIEDPEGFIRDNRKHIEDAMVVAGNQAIEALA